VVLPSSYAKEKSCTANGIQARVAYKHQAVRWGEFLLVFVAEAVLFLVALGAVVAAWQLAA
jgi:hypothetical protein